MPKTISTADLDNILKRQDRIVDDIRSLRNADTIRRRSDADAKAEVGGDQYGSFEMYAAGEAWR